MGPFSLPNVEHRDNMNMPSRGTSRYSLSGVDTLSDAFGILVEGGFRVHPVVFRSNKHPGAAEPARSDGGDDDGPPAPDLRPIHLMQTILGPKTIEWNNLATWDPELKTLTAHSRGTKPGRPLVEVGLPLDALGEDCGMVLLPLMADTPDGMSVLEAAAEVASRAHAETGATMHIWLGFDEEAGLVADVRTSIDGAPQHGNDGDFSVCHPVHCGKVPDTPVFEDLLAIADKIEPYEKPWHEAYVRMLNSTDPSLAREAEAIDMAYRLSAAISPYKEIISVCAGEWPWALDEILTDDANEFIPFMGCDPSRPGYGPSLVLRKIVECQSLENGALLAAGRTQDPDQLN